MVLRICCIDDSEICLRGVRDALANSRHQWIGSFHRFTDLQLLLQSQAVDVVISEIRVAKEDTLEVWSGIRDAYPHLKLILYCYDDNPTHVARAHSAQAWDYVHKRHPVQRLVAACDSISFGSQTPDSLIVAARHYLSRMHSYPLSVEIPLTRREKQVLAHLSLGLSNREISGSMEISLETVKEHVQNVLRKVQANDRTAAAVWAIRNGLPPLKLDSVSLLASVNLPNPSQRMPVRIEGSVP